jgi:hypothetical protein
VMFITFYIYAILGVEILYYSHDEYTEKYYNDPEFATYSNGILGNMESFSEAWLALFQVLTGSSWHYVVFHVEEFNGFFLTSIYFSSFHLIITYILRSILQGMIWEVFIIVATNDGDYENMMLDSEADSEANSDIDNSGFIPSLFPVRSLITCSFELINRNQLLVQITSTFRIYKQTHSIRRCLTCK